MGGKKAKGKSRLDRFYYLAKEQGFRSRAAFKLIQLDSKFRFLSSTRSLLDLCAAPGGWMQVAAKHMPVSSLIVGVDLVPIRPIRGALTLQEDITTPKCKAEIRKILRAQGHDCFDVVLHDGSPNVGGAWSQEATSQSALVLDSLRLATEFLAPKGTFVTKVFRSQDYNSLLYAFKQLFGKVEVTKPVASRAASAEIYVICMKYKAPAKIDPRLLDLKHLFKEIVEPPKIVDVLHKSKQKRNREGYEEGNTTLRKSCLVSDFVWSDKPLELLGSITSMSFNDPACTLIRNHPSTTDEVVALCDDLQVLSKQEFKQLLKWRLQTRKDLSSTNAPSVGDDKEEKPVIQSDKGSDDDDEDSDDEEILNEMGELKAIVEAKKKKAKKLIAKRRAKSKARGATGMQVDATGDTYQEEDLFSLAMIKAKKDLKAVESAGSSDDEEAGEKILNGEERRRKDDDEEESDLDSDTERQRYNAKLEEYLDTAYERYRDGKGGNTKRRKRAKLADADRNKSELWQVEETQNLDSQKTSLGNNESMSTEPIEANPLIVNMMDEINPSREQLAKQWFSQDVFSGYEEVEVMPADSEKKVKSRIRIEETLNSEVANMTTHVVNGASPTNAIDDEDFEVVPQEASSSSSSDSEEEEEDYDSDSKAEMLAYAKKMLVKKNREEILDGAYNRYTFNDDNLPEWFVTDEKKYCKPMKPVTKEEVEAMKAQFHSINVRPLKKVAEAKARKKRRAMKKLEKVKKQATTIADQPDMSGRSKSKMLEKLYKKATAPTKIKKKVVVAKKGGRAVGGKGKTVVDRRMKSDKRAHGMGKPGRKGKKTPSKGKRGK